MLPSPAACVVNRFSGRKFVCCHEEPEEQAEVSHKLSPRLLRRRLKLFFNLLKTRKFYILPEN